MWIHYSHWTLQVCGTIFPYYSSIQSNTYKQYFLKILFTHLFLRRQRGKEPRSRNSQSQGFTRNAWPTQLILFAVFQGHAQFRVKSEYRPADLWNTKRIKIQTQILSTTNWSTSNAIKLHFVQRACKVLHATVRFSESITEQAENLNVNVMNLSSILKCSSSRTPPWCLQVVVCFFVVFFFTDIYTAPLQIRARRLLHLFRLFIAGTRWEKTEPVCGKELVLYLSGKSLGPRHRARYNQQVRYVLLRKYFHSYVQIPVWLKRTF